ncbi:MAG: hypothetical protein ACXAEU_03180 [Candidatus Hodarchaeales archaeon]|jgi:CheY-like chemotaxis protein
MKTPQVLLVDDESIFLELTMAYMQKLKAEYNFIIATSVRAALDIAKKK